MNPLDERRRGEVALDGSFMEPPRGESEPLPASRSNRVLGLAAAVGFSIALWAFIAVAVLGLILKVVGPKNAEEGLAAAGIVMPQMFAPETKATDPATGDTLAPDPGFAGTTITTLDGRELTPASKPVEPPAKPAPAH